MSQVEEIREYALIRECAQVLDDLHPGWHEWVNPGTINMDSWSNCVGAQISIHLGWLDPETGNDPDWQRVMDEVYSVLKEADPTRYVGGAFSCGAQVWRDEIARRVAA